MLTIEPATPADLADLAARMAPEDRAEMQAAGLGPECLEGVPAQALRWRGQLVCLFGAVPAPGMAIPWMLCTVTVAQVPRRRMAAVSRQVVAGWRGQFDKLANFVHARHTRALRFLRWLGFVIDETPAGPGGAFYTFSWERPHV